MSRRSEKRASSRPRSGPARTSSFRLRPASSWSLKHSISSGASLPSVKRLVFKVIPDEATRVAALKRQRGRYRLLDPRRAGRGHPADAGAYPQADGRLGPVLGLFPRAMGPQIAVARCPGQAGREPRDQPREHQPRADARPLASDRQRDAREPRIFLAAAEAGFRPGKSQAAAGRSRLQERLRRGRVLSATRPTPIWAKRFSTIFRLPASGRGCARSNAPPSSKAMPRRSSTKA